MTKTNIPLKKGKLYAGFWGGVLSLGYYMGRVPGFLAFRGSDFTFDHGHMADGIRDEDAGEWYFIEMPDGVQETHLATWEYIQSVLPE